MPLKPSLKWKIYNERRDEINTTKYGSANKENICALFLCPYIYASNVHIV